MSYSLASRIAIFEECGVVVSMDDLTQEILTKEEGKVLFGLLG